MKQKKSCYVPVRMEQSVKDQITALAKRKGWSQSLVLRKALHIGLKRFDKVFRD